jgi:hypothetical protein
MHSEKNFALREPNSRTRPTPPAPAPGLARLRSAVERGYWELREYLDSTATCAATGLVVSGLEKHSGTPLKLLYFGSGNHLAYVLGLVYREHRVDEELGNLRIWNAGRWAESRDRDCDLVIADLPWPWHRLLRGRGFIEVPAWVNQRMPLPEQWQDVFSQLRRSARGEDMRSIRKHGLEYRLVREEEAVRRFYEEMYVPHLTRRFGDAAYIEPEWKIRYCVENGTLMEVLRDGQVVAAQVLWGNQGSLHFLWSGTVGDEYGAQSRGVFPALYYFGLLHAFEGGYREVDYCGSRPVLTDGIVQLKRRWGGQVFDGWSRDTLFIRPQNLGQANLGFLCNNPVIARCRGELVGKVIFANEPVGAEQVVRAEQVYATSGISTIRLYSLQPPQQEAWNVMRSTPGVEIVDLSGDSRPESAYCNC